MRHFLLKQNKYKSAGRPFRIWGFLGYEIFPMVSKSHFVQALSPLVQHPRKSLHWRLVEPVGGIEHSICRLQIGCSNVELHRHGTAMATNSGRVVNVILRNIRHRNPSRQTCPYFWESLPQDHDLTAFAREHMTIRESYGGLRQ